MIGSRASIYVARVKRSKPVINFVTVPTYIRIEQTNSTHVNIITTNQYHSATWYETYTLTTWKPKSRFSLAVTKPLISQRCLLVTSPWITPHSLPWLFNSGETLICNFFIKIKIQKIPNLSPICPERNPVEISIASRPTGSGNFSSLTNLTAISVDFEFGIIIWASENLILFFSRVSSRRGIHSVGFDSIWIFVLIVKNDEERRAFCQYRLSRCALIHLNLKCCCLSNCCCCSCVLGILHEEMVWEFETELLIGEMG